MVMCASGMFGRQNPNERATRPGDWTHAAAETQPHIELKFHHSISWDCLRDSWQALLEHGQWAALEAYMIAVGVSNASALRGKLHRGEDMDQVSSASVYEKISWPGWNIVQGPGNRSDEGGADVDLFDYGMGSTDAERMSNLKLLWTEMSNLLQRVDRPGMRTRREASRPGLGADVPVVITKAAYDGGVYDAASRLARAFGKMAAFKQASYIPYIHSMWDTVSAGAVNKSAVGVWDAVPEFRKTVVREATAGNMPARMRCTRCRGVYDRPKVPPRTKIWCTSCGKQTVVDFANGA